MTRMPQKIPATSLSPSLIAVPRLMNILQTDGFILNFKEKDDWIHLPSRGSSTGSSSSGRFSISKGVPLLTLLQIVCYLNEILNFSPLNFVHEVLLALTDYLQVLAISVLDPLYPLQFGVNHKWSLDWHTHNSVVMLLETNTNIQKDFHLQLGVNHQGPLD